MNRYFYDTEFLEDGKTVELISIGIVCQDGREYYAVNSELPIERIRGDDWLLRNVMPHLPVRGMTSLKSYIENPPNRHPRPSVGYVDVDREDPRVKPHWVIRNEVREFMAVGNEGDPKAELWADYAAYDHVALAQLFGRMIDLPEWIPMYTNDFQQLLRELGNPEIPAHQSWAHNALEDARHLKACFDAVRPGGEPA